MFPFVGMKTCHVFCPQWSVQLVESFTTFMETFVAVLPKHIYAGHPKANQFPLPNTKDPCPLRCPPPCALAMFSCCMCVSSDFQCSCAEGRAWLEWEQLAFKCKPIRSAVEGGRVGLEVMEDVLKGGIFWLFLRMHTTTHSPSALLQTSCSIPALFRSYCNVLGPNQST